MKIKSMSIGYTINIGNFESIRMAVEGEAENGETAGDLKRELTKILDDQLKDVGVNSEPTKDFVETLVKRVAGRNPPVSVETDRYKRMTPEGSGWMYEALRMTEHGWTFCERKECGRKILAEHAVNGMCPYCAEVSRIDKRNRRTNKCLKTGIQAQLTGDFR